KGTAWKYPPGLRRARRPGRDTLRNLAWPRLHACRSKLSSGGIWPSFRIRLRGSPCKHPRRRNRELLVLGSRRFPELGSEIPKRRSKSKSSTPAIFQISLDSPLSGILDPRAAIVVVSSDPYL